MNELKSVEIFATGKHNGDTYTSADLDAMVSAFNALDFKPALRVGHAAPGENESETPAVGWVENVRREGDKLVADFTNLADEVMALIKRKAFTRVSAEIFWNFERAGQKFSRVLKAVALLGVGIPGVAGLKPLAANFAASLFGDVKAHAYTAAFGYPNNGKDDDMSLDKDEVSRIAREAAQAATAEAEKKFTAQLDAEKKAREAAEKKYQDDLAAERKKREELADSAHKGRIKGIANSCKLPALRPFVAAFAELAMGAPAEKKYTIGSKKVDGKDVAIEATSVETVEQFVAEINAKVTKLTRESGASHVDGHDEDPAGEKAYLDNRRAAGEEADRRAKELQGKDSKLTYEAAFERVLSEDGELKAAYGGRALKAA
jgi:hypothetical protein